jgi:hypothetical protein
MMDVVSTAVVVAIVVGLMLLGIGMVINQLLRLKRYLKASPTDPASGAKPPEPPLPSD